MSFLSMADLDNSNSDSHSGIKDEMSDESAGHSLDKDPNIDDTNDHTPARPHPHPVARRNNHPESIVDWFAFMTIWVKSKPESYVHGGLQASCKFHQQWSGAPCR